MKGKRRGTGTLNWRDRGGLWLGKGARALSRLGGRGGSTLPGRLAETLAPGLLEALAGQVRRCNLVLTGSNGKTTTASLLAALLRKAGMRVVHNRTGANLTWGIASALVGEASWSGRLAADAGIMEADEAAFSDVVRAVRPRGVLVTNIFHDQLDRYGEVDSVRAMLCDGLALLPAGARVLLNADDPAVAGMAAVLNGANGPATGSGAGLPNLRNTPPAGIPRLLFYGLELDRSVSGFRSTARDLKACPRCGRRLAYSTVYFAHLGHYRCTACSFRRPRPHFRLVRYARAEGGRTAVTVAAPGERLHFTFSLPGLYNLYNGLAAAACARAFGVAGTAVESGLAAASPSFGRMEQFRLEDRPVMMGLIKNAVGGNEVLRTFLEAPGPLNLLAAVNDRYADGTDISWLWDVDFEQLEPALERISTLTVSGLRALDLAVRLRYAGIPPSRLTVERDPGRALERCLQGPAGEPLYLLLTYTAMLELRRIIHRRGAVRPYWEEQRLCRK